jgi:putative ABC transport system ATP-binding protein
MATYVTQPPKPGPLTATLIELAGVEKVYRNGKLEYRALRGVDLSITAGEMVAIVGLRGAGSPRSST